MQEHRLIKLEPTKKRENDETSRDSDDDSSEIESLWSENEESIEQFAHR